MIKKEKLIKQCRYYKGENKNPFEGKDGYQNEKMFWEYEMGWVHSTIRGYDFRIELDEYKWSKLDGFRNNDGIPKTLKALLFNRYVHWCGGYGNDKEGFVKFFDKYYPI